MSTDTNETKPVVTTETASNDAPVQATQSSEPQPSNPQASADEPAEASSQSSASAVSPAVAQTDWDEEEDQEPGDDIGNRIDGPAHHERTTVAAASPDASAPSKRRRRHRKKKTGGAEASGEEPAATATEENAAAPNTTPRRGPKSKPASAQPRERPAFRVGEEVFGKLVEIRDDALIIDLSSKAQAIFDRHELTPETALVLGENFVAAVHGDGSRGGMVVLTRLPGRVEEAKKLVEAAFQSGELVNGLVTGVIKGGLEVYVDGLRAFAPGSHVDLKLGADLHYLVGQRLGFKVLKYAKNGREVVLTRREMLEQEAASSRKQALSQLEPGAVVDAIVRSVVDWGVFVAIPAANNVEGLIHVTEASHDRSTKLSEQFHPGETVQVKVLRIDEKGKLWLSHKAVGGDPWEAAAERFAIGTRHVGRVARMQPFGVFVELAPGIDGLVRTADLSLRRVNDPSEVTAVGQELEVMVVHFDPSQRKIGLHPAPPAEENEAPQRVAPHRAVRVSVVSAEPAGLLVRILGMTGAAARGFIPAGHTGTARGTDLRREFPTGTVLEAKVLEVDSRRGESKLSIRALKEDNEKAAFNEYRAQVARESKFGTFGDLFAKRSNS